MNYRLWEIQFAGSPKILWSGVKPSPEQLATADQLGIQVSPDDSYAAVASANADGAWVDARPPMFRPARSPS